MLIFQQGLELCNRLKKIFPTLKTVEFTLHKKEKKETHEPY